MAKAEYHVALPHSGLPSHLLLLCGWGQPRDAPETEKSEFPDRIQSPLLDCFRDSLVCDFREHRLDILISSLVKEEEGRNGDRDDSKREPKYPEIDEGIGTDETASDK